MLFCFVTPLFLPPFCPSGANWINYIKHKPNNKKLFPLLSLSFVCNPSHMKLSHCCVVYTDPLHLFGHTSQRHLKVSLGDLEIITLLKNRHRICSQTRKCSSTVRLISQTIQLRSFLSQTSLLLAHLVSGQETQNSIRCDFNDRDTVTPFKLMSQV